MPLRLIEMVLPENHVGEARDLFQGKPVVDVWYDKISEDRTLIKVLVSVEDSEHLIDLLEKYFSVVEGFRLILLPVAASLPRLEEPEEGKKQEEAPAREGRAKAPRISREELYALVTDNIKLSGTYFIMVGLSGIVAAVGILNSNVAVVIGAMVIAPLLGPNMALALATTLGDRDLARSALKADLAGMSTALTLSILLGLWLEVDPNMTEIALRTTIGLGDVALALAAGTAGVLAFTSGASTAIIGMMVAVALLPPIVTLGLLLGAGQLLPALGALSLLLTNIICINLSGVVTFWALGIRPLTWWEAAIARRATIISVISCSVLLAVLVFILLFSRSMWRW